MLFARRDLKVGLSRHLSLRLANHIGRYLTPSGDEYIDQTITPLTPSACYALLGEAPTQPPADSESIQDSIQQIIQIYHHKTGRWLSQEQVAFAAIYQDVKQQAINLKKHFKRQITHLTLHSKDALPPLHLALLADALKIKQFRTPKCSKASAKPCASHRHLNVPLDETSMAEIETIGREVRQQCEANYLNQGLSLEGIHTCWRLKLRYKDCQHSLTLKCMPVDMLREVFETQHFQKYGTTDEDRIIMIDELEIEVHLPSYNTPEQAAESSAYVTQWMSQWQADDEQTNRYWNKQENTSIKEQFSWLECSTLEGILAKFTVKQADTEMPEFFLTNHQKDVDEVVMRN